MTGMMASAFTPRDLGPKLIAWWAPPDAGNTTLVSGAISSWRDEVAAYDLTQGTATSRPTYNATSFDGLACAEFDGVADHLALSPVPAAWPQSAAAGEMWVSCRQDAAPADTLIRVLFTYGGATGSTRRQLDRDVISGVNRAKTSTGTVIASNTLVDFSGVHVTRAVSTTTQLRVDVDGVAGPMSAISPATSNTRVRLGASTGATAANFWHGAVRQVLVTSLLSDEEAALLLAYLNEGL